MFIYRKLLLLIVFMIIASCSSKKQVLLLQGNNNINLNNIKYDDILIQPNDILSIKVNTLSPEITALYNPTVTTGIAATSADMIKFQGYLVNNNGEINFPILGKINVIEKSTTDIEEIIYQLLLENDQLTQHTIQVRLLNGRITIIGDVQRPGTYSFFENHINIFQAIGLAGGLQITADRKNLRIIREKENNRNIINIDLTSDDIVSSKNYQLANNDIIVVNPNRTKVKNAGIIGNSGTLISLLSFILTSIIVIRN